MGNFIDVCYKNKGSFVKIKIGDGTSVVQIFTDLLINEHSSIRFLISIKES